MDEEKWEFSFEEESVRLKRIENLTIFTEQSINHCRLYNPLTTVYACVMIDMLSWPRY